MPREIFKNPPRNGPTKGPNKNDSSRTIGCSSYFGPITYMKQKVEKASRRAVITSSMIRNLYFSKKPFELLTNLSLIFTNAALFSDIAFSILSYLLEIVLI